MAKVIWGGRIISRNPIEEYGNTIIVEIEGHKVQCALADPAISDLFRPIE